MSEQYCIKYKNITNQNYDLLYKCLLEKNQKLSKKGLINYIYSNNTNSVFSVLDNEKKLPSLDLNIFDEYKNKIPKLDKVETEELFFNKIVESIEKKKKYKKNAIVLSGGSDSILIACILCHLYDKKDIVAFTFYDGTLFMKGELKRAELVAKKLNIKHIIIEGAPKPINYIDIIRRQAFSIDRSSFHYDQISKGIINYFGDNLVDVFNGELNLLEVGFSISSFNDPTRYIRKFIYKNKKKLSFIKFFEFFKSGNLKIDFLSNSNNKYFKTLNDILRFFFEKKNNLEWMTGFYNGKSKFPGYHGIEKIDNFDFKKIFLNFFDNLELRSLDNFEEFIFSTAPIFYAGTTNVETIFNIITFRGMNMIMPFSSDALSAISTLSNFQHNKGLQKNLIRRKFNIDEKATHFVKSHYNFNYYFHQQFDNLSFKEIFKQKDYFNILQDKIIIDKYNNKQISSMKESGLVNQRQFRLFIAREILNNFELNR